MRIALIRPRVPKDAPLPKMLPDIHIGLASLAAVLENESMDVKVIDNNLLELDTAQLVERITVIQPSVVGINCDLVTINSVAELVSALKHIRVPVVVGGPEANIHPGETFTKTNPDYCVYGEAERTLPQLCRALQEHGSSPKAMQAIRGLVYRTDGNTTVITPPQPLIEDLDTLPFLALHAFDLSGYRRTDRFLSVSPVDSLFTSRGCPFHCSFCSNETAWGNRWRAMSAPRIADEIEYMMKRYGTRGVYFKDDIFTLDRKRVHDLCALIRKRHLNIKWACESRADSLDDELVRDMRSAGCEAVWFGVESGSQRMLDQLGKGVTLSRIRESFQLCKKHKLTTGASIMIGIPGETPDETMRTLWFALKLHPSIVLINIFLGIPGSPIYETIVRENLVHARYGGLVLPRTKQMTWEQKQRLVFLAKLFFSLRPAEIRRDIQERGFFGYFTGKIRNAVRALRHGRR